MKKSGWICLIVIASLLLVGGIVFGVVMLMPTKVESFDLEDYRTYLENESFQVDLVLGETETAEDAKEKAEDVWIERYGKDVKSQRPYAVYFDEQSEVWLVTGRLHFWADGGTASILIQKSDGRVLAVWHGK